jgi:hypothetical protein
MKPRVEHRVDQNCKESTQLQRPNTNSPKSSQDSSPPHVRAWYDDLDAKDLEYLDRLLSSGSDDNTS